MHNCVKCGSDMPYLLDANFMQDPFSVNVGFEYPCPKCGTLNVVAGTAMPTAFTFIKLNALNPNEYRRRATHHAKMYSVHKTFQENMNVVLAFGKLPTYMKFHFEVFHKHFKPISREAGITTRTGRRPAPQKPLMMSYRQTDSTFRFVPAEGMFLGLHGRKGGHSTLCAEK
jgi:hypothetical protein